MRKGANVADLLLRDTDPDELRAGIVDDVLKELRLMLDQRAAVDKRIATRAEMARMLEWSIAKLDRETAAKRIPSLLSGDRRSYVIDDVIAAIKAGTEAAEVDAAARQAAKRAAKKKTGESE